MIYSTGETPLHISGEGFTRMVSSDKTLGGKTPLSVLYFGNPITLVLYRESGDVRGSYSYEEYKMADGKWKRKKKKGKFKKPPWFSNPPYKVEILGTRIFSQSVVTSEMLRQVQELLQRNH